MVTALVDARRRDYVRYALEWPGPLSSLRATQANQVPDGTDPRRLFMKWHTPKIVEIACGGEINAYFPAEL